MTRKFILPNTPRREKVDAVAKIVKSVCGVSQSDAFNIAKHACVFQCSEKECREGIRERKIMARTCIRRNYLRTRTWNNGKEMPHGHTTAWRVRETSCAVT